MVTLHFHLLSCIYHFLKKIIAIHKEPARPSDAIFFGESLADGSLSLAKSLPYIANVNNLFWGAFSTKLRSRISCSLYSVSDQTVAFGNIGLTWLSKEFGYC